MSDLMNGIDLPGADEALVKGVFPGAELIQRGSSYVVQVASAEHSMFLANGARTPEGAWRKAADVARDVLKGRKANDG